MTLPFIENQGQINEVVRYYAPVFSGNVYVTEESLTYTVDKIEEEAEEGYQPTSLEDALEHRLDLKSYSKQKLKTLAFKERLLYLHRACAIEIFRGNRNKEIYFKNSEETFARRAGLGLGQPVRFKDPKDIENPDFMVVTDNVLAIGDSDIISDVFFSKAKRIGFVEMIIDFLKSDS